jgi:hypothetical protein
MTSKVFSPDADQPLEAGVGRRHLERGAIRHDDLVGKCNFHRGLLRSGSQSKIRVESEFRVEIDG